MLTSATIDMVNRQEHGFGLSATFTPISVMVEDKLALSVMIRLCPFALTRFVLLIVITGQRNLLFTVTVVPIGVSLLILVWHVSLLWLFLVFMLGRRPGVRFSGATLAQHVVLRLRDRWRILHGRDNSLLRVHSPHTTSTRARRTGPPRLASWGRRWCRTRSPSGCPTA